jgi:arylsulfatase A-like enzyme
LIATVANILNKDLDANTGEDSFSFLEAFSGEDPDWNENRGVVHHSDAGFFAIRQGKWKLIYHESGGTRRLNPKSVPVQNPANIQLFDMETDPSELVNVQHLNPDVVNSLTSLMNSNCLAATQK